MSDAAVRDHIGMTDRSNFRRTVKRHADLVAALEELEILDCKDGKLPGFRRGAAIHFGNLEEA